MYKIAKILFKELDLTLEVQSENGLLSERTSEGRPVYQIPDNLFSFSNFLVKVFHFFSFTLLFVTNY